MRNVINVDILNTGTLFGKLKTPAYGIPIEYSLYETLKDLGFNIRISTESTKSNKTSTSPKIANTEPVVENIEKIESDDIIVNDVEPVVADETLPEKIEAPVPGDDNYDVFDNITEDQKKSELNKVVDRSKVEKWMTKEFYSKNMLEKYTKDQLISILNCRGHFCSRTGNRDFYAPKFTDTKTSLINKVLETNAKV